MEQHLNNFIGIFCLIIETEFHHNCCWNEFKFNCLVIRGNQTECSASNESVEWNYKMNCTHWSNIIGNLLELFGSFLLCTMELEQFGSILIHFLFWNF